MAAQSVVERSILKALDGPATCTNETLLSIKSILSSNSTAKNGKEEKENVRAGAGHARAKSLVSTAKVTKTTARAKGPARQLTVVEIKAEVILNEQEKVNLAFQVVNGCIKMLSQLAREHAQSKRGAAEADGDVTAKKIGAKIAPSDTALRPKSPNARRTKPIHATCKSAAKTSTPTTIVAACAFAAIAHLQAHYKVEDGTDTTFQVENGALAVIGKCIDLELADLALEQLKVLKRRVMAYLGMKGATEQTTIALHDLLEFPSEVEASAMLQFAIKIQQNAWQLVLLRADTRVLEAIADSAHPRCALLRLYAAGLKDPSKAGKQLANMSKLLLQASAMQGLTMDALFILRCSAYDLRVAATEFGQQLLETEAQSISSRLSRCADALFRSSKSTKDRKVVLVEALLLPLLDPLGQNQKCKDDATHIRGMLQRLSGNSSTNGQDSLIQTSRSQVTELPLEIIRIAIDSLAAKHDTDALQQAAELLLKPLPKEKSVADRLLVDLVGLRRALHKAVSERKIRGVDGFSAAAGCIDYLRRYLGCTLHRRKQDATQLEERLRVGKKFVKPFISTLIVCCLHHDAPGQDVFTTLEVATSMFLEVMECDTTFADERFGDSKDPGTSIFITISKLCHKIWNSCVSANGNADDLAVIALKTGIQIMEPWTPAEKETAMLTLKLRYLMDAQVAREEWTEATATLERLLDECITSGLMAELVGAASVQSLYTLREAGTIGAILSRCMQSNVTVLRKSDTQLEDLVFSRPELDPAFRGMLLEWQLEHFTTYALQQRTTDSKCRPLVKQTLEHLMELYNKKDFPIRRLRTGLAAARLLSTMPELCDPHELLTDVSVDPRIKSFGLDAGFKDSRPYQQAMLQAAIALFNPHGDDTLQLLQDALECYTSITATEYSADLDVWIDHLEAIANFYALRRDVLMESRALGILARSVIALEARTDRQVKTLCRLAGTLLAMGRTSQSHEVLAMAETKVKSGKCSDSAHISWLLSKAEHSIAVSDLEQSKTALMQAARMAANGGEHSFVTRTLSSSSATLNVDDRRLVARAMYLNASLHFREGQIAAALRFCTVAKCMLFKIWSSLEQLMPRETPSKPPDACPSSDDTSAMEGVQPVAMTRSYSHLSSPQLRMLVPDLLQVAMLEMKIHDFRGSYHDAFAALKHANKIANYVGAGAACLSDMAAADLYIRSLPLNSLSVREEKVQSARSRIDMVDKSLLESIGTLDVLELGAVRAAVLAAEEEPEDQLETLEATMKKVQSLARKADASQTVVLSTASSANVDAVADQLATMRLDKQKKGASKPTKAKVTTAKPASKKSAPVKRSKAEAIEEKQQTSSVDLETWHGALLRQISMALLQYQAEPDLDELSGLIEEAGITGCDAVSRAEQGIASARLLSYQASEQMAADIAFNALHDCILSVPTPQQRDAVVEAPAPVPAKTPRKGKTAKAAPKPVTTPDLPFLPLLKTAFENLRQNWPTSCLTSSVASLRLQGHLMSGLSATASACSQGTAIEVSHPLVLAYHNDLPNLRSSNLNKAVEHPGIDKIQKDDLRSWPSLDMESLPQQTTEYLERSSFQHFYIDIIPKSWNVVSISLADDRTSMKLVRYRAGQSPFCLRIPFAHRESEDPDEEVLDMSLACERLRAIIKQHEFTPAEAGVTDQAEFKKKWWQKKHELDLELRMLLSDVEEQWFSAVKGIFSARQCDAQALSNLHAALQTILAQHCPAKKTKGKGKATVQAIKLEPRILELFVGLGDPDTAIEVEGEEGFVTQSLAETAIMADGIHDLVRLILEGLQFAGESIAIDEVDMDNVIIKVVDALRDYYGMPTDVNVPAAHTVLILDNQLHGFPWESLPCLRDQSVSRLPSLAELRDRIIAARAALTDDAFTGKTISRKSGTSLLNPSGDLKKTAQRFQPWLSKLSPNWAHLRKAPNDEGWRDLLSENELFLYVGHGSTSQYVRPRVVKRLGYNEPNATTGSTCAVSWLIGCGSVAVEDLGEFEPSGMVLSYLAAGSPAVLGALWDVGDIDADHFSITAGDYWGLWDESNKGLDPKLFPARKKIAEEKRAMGRALSMCEAVARSRGGCKLPYLNGAAFVVYGIPVFLD